MPVQHERRSGADRRRFDLSLFAPIGLERRWNKDPRRSVVNEDEEDLYEPDWDAAEASFLESSSPLQNDD